MSTEHSGLGRDDRARTLVERMAEVAASWLSSLSPDQRRKAALGFPEQDERTRWYYTPNEQGGLPLVEMDPPQQRLAHQLIASGLSLPGYVAVSTIMGLENVLDALEGWQMSFRGRRAPNRGRDPLLYFVTVFGEPGSGTWGWRVGGHHLSLSYTLVDGRIAMPTPVFFGANPAESPLVGSTTLRPLAGEEDLGRELVRSLDAEQRASAILAPLAPTDIILTNRPSVEVDVAPQALVGAGGHDGSSQDEQIAALRYEAQPKGLAAARMTPAQREMLDALVRQYVARLPDEVAEPYLARVARQAEGISFAWAGGLERRQPHYYRVQGPRLLVEYDNTQNDTNHIHAVLRDPEGDFGADLLAEHYRSSH